MIDATISCARLRDLACLGRSRPAQPGEAGLRRPSASRRRTGTEASGIAASTSARPGAARSRPGSDDLMASTIWRTVKLAVAATAPLGADVLERLAAHYEIAFLLTRPDAPRGRGRRVAAPPA